MSLAARVERSTSSGDRTSTNSNGGPHSGFAATKVSSPSKRTAPRRPAGAATSTAVPVSRSSHAVPTSGMTRERQLDLGREDPQLGALAVVDEHRLGEAELVGDRLARALRHRAAVEEDAEPVAAAAVGGAEDPQDVEGRAPAAAAHQWRKWRRPVKTIAAPASSQAATTSSSRFEPPGWINAVAPASIAVSGPSGKGKNASEASDEPASSLRPPSSARVAGLVDRDPHRVDPAHLPGADPDRRAVLGKHDRVRAHVAADLPGEQQVAPLLLGRLRRRRHRHRVAALVDPVGVLDQQAAADPLHVALARP